MTGYCDYCGMGYIEVACSECNAVFETCGCNPCQGICDECDLEGFDESELRDIIQDLRRQVREMSREDKNTA